MYDDDDGARRIKDLWNEKQQREGIKIYKAHTHKWQWVSVFVFIMMLLMLVMIKNNIKKGCHPANQQHILR